MCLKNGLAAGTTMKELVHKMPAAQRYNYCCGGLGAFPHNDLAAFMHRAVGNLPGDCLYARPSVAYNSLPPLAGTLPCPLCFARRVLGRRAALCIRAVRAQGPLCMGDWTTGLVVLMAYTCLHRPAHRAPLRPPPAPPREREEMRALSRTPPPPPPPSHLPGPPCAASARPAPRRKILPHNGGPCIAH